jgi:peptidyl-prolyl cis-trans isomerase SurA
MRPKLTAEQTEWAILKLDSIANLVRIDSLTFDKAAMRFSSDKATRVNGGKMVQKNPSDRVTWFTLDELPREINLVVRDMKLGEISEPFRTTDEKGNNLYVIVRLDNEIPPHRIDMREDYNYLSQAALNDKQGKAYQDWIAQKIKKTYIRVSDDFRSCGFHYSGWLE